MPEIVQEIGAYAGLASVVGLAVLSVLYFSQARDVKRLREWAGRAPERAEQGTAVTQPTQGRVVAQPQPKAQPQAQPAKAPAVPAATGARSAAAPAAATPAQDKQAQPAAAPAAAGAAAAATGPATATAQSGQQNAPAAPQQQPASATTALKEGAPPPAQPQPTPGSGQPAATPAGAQGAPAGTAAKTGAPPVPGAPRPAAGAAAGAAAGGRQGGPPLPPAPSPARPLPGGRPTPQQTQVIPPERESWHQRIFGSTRNLILAIGGVLLLGAGVALALTQLSGDESEPSPAGQAQQQPQVEENNGGEENGEGRRRNRPAIEPSSVTVAVLNGTTVPGLAAQVSDEVQSAGFEVGTVANSSDQQRAESVILFAPGHEREAAAVSRRLDIAQREPIDAATQGLAGDATVVVVTGADRS